MRFKIDENLPVEVAELLRRHGHDALTVNDQRLGDRPDHDVARVCVSERRALVTLDLDFADIRRYPPEDHPGIIVLRPPLQTIPALLQLTSRVAALLIREPLDGRLWVVDERRARIRGLEAAGGLGRDQEEGGEGMDNGREPMAR